MSKIIHTFIYYFLPRVIGIATLTLAFSANGLTKNICSAGASLVNPYSAATPNNKNNGSAVVIQSGIGGTGIQDGGIGGTGNKEGGTVGQVANDDGIGGTGIIGIITGFASICVNGVKIHYDANTPISIDGRLSSTQDLAVGQMVAVRASGIGDEVTARNIAVIHAVVGPIDSFNPETGKMQVLDQLVQVLEQDRLENLQTSDWVQVSGHRLSDGTIVASRIEPSQPLEQAMINGHVTHADTTGFIVNGTRIEFEQHERPEGIVPGAEISASGQWNNESLQLQHVQVAPTDQLMDQVERVVIEGYVQPINNEEFSLGNQTFRLEQDLQISGDASDDISQDLLIQASGQLSPGQSVIVNQIELTTLSVTHISDAITDQEFHIDNDNEFLIDKDDESEKNEPPELEKESNEDIDTDENHNGSLDEGNNDSIGEESEVHSSSDHSLESVQHISEQIPDDPSLLDSTEHGYLEHTEDSHLQDGHISSPHESLEIFEELDSFNQVDDHLDTLMEHDAFDAPYDHDIHHDMYDDMHLDRDFDWDFDTH